jgi:hypothetical protein
MSWVDSSLRRLGAPVLVVVALTGYAVVALGDPDVEISHAAAVVAGGGVGIAGFVAVTILLRRDDEFPWRALLVGAGVLLALTALVLALPSDEGDLEPPSAGTGQGSTPASSDRGQLPPSDGGLPNWMIVVLVVVAVVVAALAWRRVGRRHRRTPLGPESGRSGRVVESDDSEEHQRERQARAVREGLSRGRTALLDEDDPRVAVVRAYLAFERHVSQYGLAREPAETEAEYATRVLASGRLSAPERVGGLVDLFNVARFSELPVGPDDARAARAHIDAMVGVR